jgi:hypothetical protein
MSFGDEIPRLLITCNRVTSQRTHKLSYSNGGELVIELPVDHRRPVVSTHPCALA